MKRKVTLAGGTLVALVLTVASTAWACTPQPRSFSVAPDTATAKSIASVVGQGVPAGAPVEVHWNSLEGNVIGTATADDRGRFSLPVTVPDGPPGAYSIVFTARGANGSVSGVGRLPFRLTSAASGVAPAAPGKVWSAAGREPATAPSGSGRGVAAGIGLMSLGLVTLAGGSLAVIARRRRATATG